jgi:negative regulator of sigma E activity
MRTRINRRDTRVIAVTPRDEFRYGYRLWIDETTAMPLKTQLCDAHGRIIEQVVFASLTLAGHIADSAFRPEVATDGFQWLRNDATPPGPGVPNTSALWSALKLPPGFRMTVRSAQVLPGAHDPVAHLVFTDGLASVSVFVESRAAEPPRISRPPGSRERRLRIGVLHRHRRPQGDRGRRGASGHRALHRLVREKIRSAACGRLPGH